MEKQFANVMADLEAYCQEFGCSKREALLEILADFYECAGFRADVLEKELASMSDEELLEANLIL